MGYTHYWKTSLQGIPKPNWDAACKDVRTLLLHLPEVPALRIAFENDEPSNPPKVSATVIRFNGTGPKGTDLGHETFLFKRNPEQPDYDKGEPEVFGFCKTAHKPYDIVVCGVLIVLTKHAPEYVDVSSDGDLDDWMPAFEWVASVLGKEWMSPVVASKLLGGKFPLEN